MRCGSLRDLRVGDRPLCHRFSAKGPGEVSREGRFDLVGVRSVEPSCDRFLREERVANGDIERFTRRDVPSARDRGDGFGGDRRAAHARHDFARNGEQRSRRARCVARASAAGDDRRAHADHRGEPNGRRSVAFSSAPTHGALGRASFRAQDLSVDARRASAPTRKEIERAKIFLPTERVEAETKRDGRSEEEDDREDVDGGTHGA